MNKSHKKFRWSLILPPFQSAARVGLQLDPQLGVSAEPRWLRGLPQSTQARKNHI